ncbi:MAG: vitamin B12-dependent ribonucleotide reductase [Planctomycetia bacterium]|nr:vitamin B12-dependent ribonucleotide reductase [Planctomycetia bacterium]MCC7316107.1 vitamin B12-dependent ribonucleotide reductase [Planctomycetota bacterium]
MVNLSTDRMKVGDKDVAPSARYGEFGLTENALRVLRARYLEKNESGECTEQPDDLFERVARVMADVELTYGGNESCRSEWKARFKNLMASRKFMPNSPTLMNAGRSMGMLSACFVLPVPDSIDGIFDSIKHTALIQKAGGGTGFAFDALRPTGDYIKSSGGTTSGPISFWRAFSEATNAIQQGAFRRGANMGMMYVHHPDIIKFLHAKQDLTQFTNYNISVKMTDEWMDAFLKDPHSPHLTRNPRNNLEFYVPKSVRIADYSVKDLIPTEKYDGLTPVYTRQDIWDIIIKHAWQTGEPGVVFMDRINEANPTPHVGRMEATNPCGEQPLLPYEACNLGSINLGLFVKDACTADAEVDWDALRTAIHESVRFLDNVIDANNYPLPQIDDVCKANRKIGLGVMGFADALYKLGVPYNSDAGVSWGERFMKFLNDESHNYSEKLALERGSFPNWTNSAWDTQHHRPMRNSCATTVAPTGTISIIADCSGGVEPMFSLAFFRNVLKGQEEGKTPMIESNETFVHVARERGFYSEGLMEQIAKEGTLAHIDDIPEDVRAVFVCAHDISPEWHIKMQAAFQKHCDSSISKTINFPSEAGPADVDGIYRMAYSLRCKGVTVYRDGCRSSQPMALADSEKKHEEMKAKAAGSPSAAVAPSLDREVIERKAEGERMRITTERNLFGERITEVKKTSPSLEPRELPSITSGIRVRQQTPFGNMHIQITVDPQAERELEVFAQLGKGGDIATSDLEAICRMISLWLRAGGRLSYVIKQLSGIGSSMQIPTRDGRIMSLGDGLAQGLKKYTKAKERFGLRALLLGEVDPSNADAGASPKNGNGNGGDKHDADVTITAGRLAEPAVQVASHRNDYKLKCPECGGVLDFGEGCTKCHGCGYSHC